MSLRRKAPESPNHDVILNRRKAAVRNPRFPSDYLSLHPPHSPLPRRTHLPALISHSAVLAFP
jgi:hypothetical protein